MQVLAIQPVLFLSHGGGPLPLLDDPAHAELLLTYALIRHKLDALPHSPSALLFISAHWETREPTLTAAAQPSLLFDYYGFPPQSYQLRYPVVGAPELAVTLAEQLGKWGWTAHLDSERGLDHGVFVPGMLLFPRADIPCLQLSLFDSLDAAAHLQLGHALRALRNENVLIIGSGFSFHNMRAFFDPVTQQEAALNLAFENWLEVTLRLEDERERERCLLKWKQAPGAAFCHPREEHLLPIHVCAAAAGKPVTQEWRFTALNRHGSCYWWD
ncbi:DODA-type extradiol aromatic ring-opening family dioxygenase [Halopseudomonas pelagia]|uniref:DODA-type extradiol aromatic ring-opening family dioxygenase n=1 Tax=Halopseudomonas pelagia TaxID=553151 RepID=UPI0003A2B717|nr:class III extradiol ring-cleavage dioxygenase [Halopseudomonas pelagia]